jgi:transcriptional regulator with XRE-family HTH domain
MVIDLKIVLADNLRELMASRPELSKQMDIRRRAALLGCPVSQSTISRVLNAQVAIDLDTLATLGRVFAIDPAELIRPHPDKRRQAA